MSLASSPILKRSTIAIAFVCPILAAHSIQPANSLVSGVIYLKVPEKEGNDGSIEFSLHGKELPILDPGYPKKMYRVSEGDIIMFPSSLFHRTTPFYSDSKRLCIAFDMVPVET